MVVIISYDVVSTKRRNRIHKALKGYGLNSQRSVFECDIEPGLINRLVEILEKLINKDEDDVRIYRLCSSCDKKIITLGIADFSRTERVIAV